MKRVFICIIILLPAAVPVDGLTVELTLHPAKAPEPAQKYQLLPKAEEQTDADAAPLYEKALQALPKNFQIDQISQWLKTPPAKLPRQQVQSTLQHFKPTLQFLEQAAKCKQCDWPYLDDDTWSQNLREYRTLAFFLALQVRVQIAQGQYDKAIGTVQTGFAMVMHLSKAPTLAWGSVGLAISELICRQLELFVQRPDAPNLYLALRGLPQPFIDLTEQLEMDDSGTGEKMRSLMNRSNRRVVALQCVEALRLYAAAHDGKFPKELSSITEVPVPSDPVMQKPFVYRCTGPNAVLEAPAPKGATEREAIRYELKLKEGT
jgi:tetratricopeptide (TPR) repeat protein